MRFFHRLILSFAVCFVWVVPSSGQETVAPSSIPAPRLETTAGLYGMYNPKVAAAFVEVLRSYPYAYSVKYRDVWSKRGFGAQGVFCPAYSNMGVLLEWMPALFAVIRARYDVYFYHGFFGEVLSYDEIPAGFTESDLSARSGDEAAAFGQRVMFQPTLRGQLGKVMFQNQTDGVWYDTRTDGPYIFNWDYETFTRLSDFIIENRTDLPIEMQRGAGETQFLIGPQYTLTYAVRTRLRRQRVGVSVYWVPRDRPDISGYLFLCLASGVNIEAVLEEKSPYLLLIVGGFWTRKDKN